MGDSSKVHSFEEVKKHNDRKDCWLLIDGKVYDVTEFLDDHPGGDEVLLAATEKDATEDFKDVGHSGSAKEMMQKYLIGEIDSSTLPAPKKYKPPQQVAQKREETSGGGNGFIIKLLQFFVPLLFLAAAFAYQFYGKEKEY
ncbi:hypothetical protein ACFE04_018573 [Oxalis oulophora]